MNYTEVYYEKVEQLNKDRMQKKALNAVGNTVVLAGPGSGKTSVLTVKATMLLNNSIEPFGIACITYSREAAIVMGQRIKSYGVSENKRLFVGTIHNFCITNILMPFGEIFELKLPFPLRIATASDRKKAFETAKEIVEGAENITDTDMNTERRNKVGKLSSIKPPSYDVALKTAIEYEKLLHTSGFIDFEDIINYSVYLIQEHEYVREALSAKYPWILIDEYQDLGKPLHEIVLSLLHFTEIKLFIVGDPDQSIYGFTGANPRYINELIETTRFECIVLENNYRSPQGIVDASIDVLGQKREYHSATDEFIEAKFDFIELTNGWVDQFNYIAEHIIPKCDSENIPREEIAILIKNHSEIAVCSKLLEKYGIECYISKKGFDRTPLIHWLENCAAWCSGSFTNSLIEIFNEWCCRYDYSNSYFIGGTSSIIAFRNILDKAKSINKLTDWIDYLMHELHIPELIDIDEMENLNNFIEIINSEEFEHYSVDMFSKIGKPINQVVLLTWFAAKGLEFDLVILTGMDEGMMPDYKALNDSEHMEEQSRMCFVGVSRAKKNCILLRSRQYSVYSKKYNKYYTHDYTPSRFWNTLLEKYGCDYLL